MATLIKHDGEHVEVEPENGSGFQLKELYDMLECELIQVIDLLDGRIMVIDEEGKLDDHHMNEEATQIAAVNLFAGDYIAGHALVCDSSQLK